MTDIEVVAGGRHYIFSGDAPVVIGRDPGAAVPVGDRTVGRHHARLLNQAGSWALVDESSRNGTWVAGVRVSVMVVDRPIVAYLGGPDSSTWVSIRPVAAGQPRPPSPVPAPVLITRFAGQQRLFPMGGLVRIGREPGLELVTENPLVTRHQHGLLTSDPSGATYTDTSSRGTFVAGKKLTGPLHMTESTLLRLGDPATGEELGVTPPLSAAQLAANQQRRSRRRRTKRALAAAAAVVLVAAATASAVVLTRPSGGLSAASLARATAATVRLLDGTPADYQSWGSGTIVSANGLILTNGHVAEPQAPGEAVSLGEPAAELDANPPFVTVELTEGEATAAVARYRARVVAVDGYLDLAVVQIYATSSGQPVNRSSLHLPWLETGDVAQLVLNQTVTVLGYPGVSGSDSITITSGVISTFVPDPLGHVADPRFMLETTARVAHGNSGGAAIDDQGRLIGVPSLTITGEGSDISWRLRSVAEAAPLLAAARAGRPYVSHLLVASQPGEVVTTTGIGSSQAAACGGGQAVAVGTASAMVGVSYQGFPVGLDGAIVVTLPDGSTVQDQDGSLPQFIFQQADGCYLLPLSASDLGLATLPAGGYQVQLLAGPNLDPVGPNANVSVGASGSLP